MLFNKILVLLFTLYCFSPTARFRSKTGRNKFVNVLFEITTGLFVAVAGKRGYTNAPNRNNQSYYSYHLCHITNNLFYLCERNNWSVCPINAAAALAINK